MKSSTLKKISDQDTWSQIKNEVLDNTAFQKQLRSSIIFSHCEFKDVILKGGDITAVIFFHCKFYNLKVEDSTCYLCSFDGCQFSHATFFNSELIGNGFNEATFIKTKFLECLLNNATFLQIVPDTLYFEDCNIREAIFTERRRESKL